MHVRFCSVLTHNFSEWLLKCIQFLLDLFLEPITHCKHLGKVRDTDLTRCQSACWGARLGTGLCVPRTSGVAPPTFTAGAGSWLCFSWTKHESGVVRWVISLCVVLQTRFSWIINRRLTRRLPGIISRQIPTGAFISSLPSKTEHLVFARWIFGAERRQPEGHCGSNSNTAQGFLPVILRTQTPQRASGQRARPTCPPISPTRSHTGLGFS